MTNYDDTPTTFSKNRDVRTSSSHPLKIAEIKTGKGHGCIGITFAPGKTQADGMSGAWARSLADDLDVIAAWNASAVITLVEPFELEAMQIEALGLEVKKRHMEWHHWPIKDVSVPSAEFNRNWVGNAEKILSLLKGGSNVLIHCKGGLGRAGMVSARLLVELGMEPSKAIAAVRFVRPGAIETRPQENWVSAVRAIPIGVSDSDPRERALGAFLGLAVGDAVGTTIEFVKKPKFAIVQDMVGGGPFSLKAGQWTDDTAMALALADSLIAFPHFDARDLMIRFSDWRRRGTYSCTGECFDCGNTVSAALDRFEATGDPIAGTKSANSAGNGALMRLSPVAIRFWNNDELLAPMAAAQTQTSHGAKEAVDASILFASILADAIRGASRDEVLSARAGNFGPKITKIASGETWRGIHRDRIQGTGYVVDSLNAALWAISRTTDYKTAILLAANLGEDADTTAAITGQLAGAIYGVSGIPSRWLDQLAWRDRLTSTGSDLYSASLKHQ